MTGAVVLRRVLEEHADTIRFCRQRVVLAERGSYATSAERAVAALADAVESAAKQ